MQRLPERPSRKEALEHIASSAQYGNLGAFIGAGLSKAILNDEFDGIALSWGDLLEKAATEMGVNYTDIEKSGKSYPEIASLVCAQHADLRGISYADSLRTLKRTIAELTAWYPNARQREAYSTHLETLSPSWIITTNYDLIIEALLTGKSTPLGPNDALSAARGVVPVFHLHGRRTNPEEIVIAQEDYVALFRPGEYRQVKLALTIKESTTVLLGYGLGDVNVLTAIDWSRNVYGDGEEDYPADVIQILRKENPRNEPYRDQNGILIIEASDLPAFFEELAEVKKEWIENYNKKEEAVREIADTLNAPDDALVDRFIDELEFRNSILKAIAKFPTHLAPGFISFLSKAIDKTYERTIPYGAFEGYNQNLNQILDILTAFNLSEMSPALFQTAAYALDRVGRYVGQAAGQSYAAGGTWNRRKGEIAAEMVAELKNFAERHYCMNLKRLMGEVAA